MALTSRLSRVVVTACVGPSDEARSERTMHAQECPCLCIPGPAQAGDGPCTVSKVAHLDGERLRYAVLGLVQASYCFLKRLVLQDELQGALGPNATDCPTVVAAAKNAYVDELLLQQLNQSHRSRMQWHAVPQETRFWDGEKFDIASVSRQGSGGRRQLDPEIGKGTGQSSTACVGEWPDGTGQGPDEGQHLLWHAALFGVKHA